MNASMNTFVKYKGPVTVSEQEMNAHSTDVLNRYKHTTRNYHTRLLKR